MFAYKEEDEFMPHELIKMERRVNASTNCCSESQNRQMSESDVAESIECFLQFFNRDEKTGDMFFIIKKLRAQYPYNLNLSEMFFTLNRESPITFAQCLYEILNERLESPIDKITADESEQIIFEDIIAFMANLSFANADFARGFFNLKVLELLLDNFDNLYYTSIIHLFRLTCGILGPLDRELFGQLVVVKKYIDVFGNSLFYDDVNIRYYSIAVFHYLAKFSDLLDDEFIKHMISIVLEAFNKEYMDLRPGITVFFFNLASNWKNAFPEGFNIFPNIIKQGLANKEDDMLLYYSLYLTRIMFSKCEEYGVNSADLLQHLSIPCIVELFHSPFESVQIISLSAFDQIISDPLVFDYAFESGAGDHLTDILINGNIKPKRKAADVICTAFEKGGIKASFLLNSDIISGMFEVIDTIRDSKKALRFAQMLQNLSSFEQYEDVMCECDAVEFLRDTEAFENDECTYIINELLEKLDED